MYMLRRNPNNYYGTGPSFITGKVRTATSKLPVLKYRKIDYAIATLTHGITMIWRR